MSGCPTMACCCPRRYKSPGASSRLTAWMVVIAMIVAIIGLRPG